jgi:hypothetical protein
MLGTALLKAALMALLRRDVAYLAVLAWAFGVSRSSTRPREGQQVQVVDATVVLLAGLGD